MARKKKRGKLGKDSGKSDRVIKSLFSRPETSDWKKGITISNPFSKKNK